MTTIIDTSRLILRPINKSDAQHILDYRSDAETNKYQGWIPTTIEDVYTFIEKLPSTINIPESWYQLLITKKEGQEIIGDIGIHFIDEEQVEIGSTLSKVHQRKGYASEALKGVIDYLFNDLIKHRITASIDPRNGSSIALVEHLGLKKEAHFRKSLFINEEWVDDVIYAILREDYVAKR